MLPEGEQKLRFVRLFVVAFGRRSAVVDERDARPSFLRKVGPETQAHVECVLRAQLRKEASMDDQKTMPSVGLQGMADISRRTLVRGAAWSVPVIAAATVVPQSVASGASLCEPVEFTIGSGQPAPGDNFLEFAAQDEQGNNYTIAISSEIGASTTVGQKRDPIPNYPEIPYVSYNMNTSGDGWQGTEADDGRWDNVFSGFAPDGAGAIVLNQRASVSPEPNGHVPNGSDIQTLTLEFTKNGQVFNPANLVLDIFDITSVHQAPRPNTNPGDGSPWHPASGPLGWRQNYWDAVGFGIAPTVIEYTGTVAEYGQGAGSGTHSDPYRRREPLQPTQRSETVSDRFTFSSFPSGTTMTFTNFNNERGWHFISISGIRFDADECV